MNPRLLAAVMAALSQNEALFLQDKNKEDFVPHIPNNFIPKQEELFDTHWEEAMRRFFS